MDLQKQAGHGLQMSGYKGGVAQAFGDMGGSDVSIHIGPEQAQALQAIQIAIGLFYDPANSGCVL
ncbi:MAG TPA: hypothetical protein VFB21_06935 [Chthonomonadaceae bacterium]|nr:hypothetical protein [Chthonomonadaceae bacterium]